jgi:NitT/TauT family transport system substrate-binding protein
MGSLVISSGVPAHGAPRGSTRRRRLTAAIATIMLTAACSPGKSDKGTPVNEAIKIRVSGAEGLNSASPFFVAQQQGFFKEAGLDVTFETMSGGTPAMAAALTAGQVDVGIGSAFQWMEDGAKGVIKGKIIGELTDNNYVLLGRPGITDVRQLKGKVFAISSHASGDYFFARSVLSRLGVKPDDMVWLPMGDPPSRLSALLAGRVDGIELSLTNVPASATQHIILMPDQSPVPFVSNVLFARQALLDSNRPALVKFIAAVGKGADWIRAHPDEAVPAGQLSGTDAEGCKNAIRLAMSSKSPYTWSSTARVNADGIKAMMPIITEAVPEAGKVTAEQLVDMSIAGGGS